MFRLGNVFFIPDGYKKSKTIIGGAGEYSLGATYHQDIIGVKHTFELRFDCLDVSTKERFENLFDNIASGSITSINFYDDESETGYTVTLGSNNFGLEERLASNNGIYYTGAILLREV